MNVYAENCIIFSLVNINNRLIQFRCLQSFLSVHALQPLAHLLNIENR